MGETIRDLNAEGFEQIDCSVKPYSMEDLNRHFATGKWCPKCGRFTPIHIMHEQDDKLHCAVCHSDGDAIKPPLWERCPECRPKYLVTGGDHFVLCTEWGSVAECPIDLAAHLCVMGVVEAVRKMRGTVTFGSSRDGELVLMSLMASATVEGISPHLPHAVAIATHRWRDAVEAKG